MIDVDGYPRDEGGRVRVTLDAGVEEALWWRALYRCWEGRRVVEAARSVTGEQHYHGAGPAVEGLAREALRRLLVEEGLYPISPVTLRWEHREWRLRRDHDGWLPGPPSGVQEGRCTAGCLAGPAPELGPPEALLEG